MAKKIKACSKGEAREFATKPNSPLKFENAHMDEDIRWTALASPGQALAIPGQQWLALASTDQALASPGPALASPGHAGQH